MATFDSTCDTLKHIRRVNELLIDASMELLSRAKKHDESKLHSPEKELFDEATCKLRSLPFGTPAYQKSLDDLKPALDHHYLHNAHHPQHYAGGVNDMTLFDLLEMFLDWKASSERHDDGDIMTSIEINQKRFGMSEQLTRVFQNTALGLGW